MHLRNIILSEINKSTDDNVQYDSYVIIHLYVKTLQKTQRNDIPQTQDAATLGEGKYGDKIDRYKCW